MSKLDEVVDILQKNFEHNARKPDEFEKRDNERIEQRKSGGRGSTSKYINPDGTLKAPAKKAKEFGGEGSGHFGHAGRPGEVGGSAPGEGGGNLPELGPPPLLFGRGLSAEGEAALQRAMNQHGPGWGDLQKWDELSESWKSKVFQGAQARVHALDKELEDNEDATDPWADERRENIAKALEGAQEELEAVGDILVYDAAARSEIAPPQEDEPPTPLPKPVGDSGPFLPGLEPPKLEVKEILARSPVSSDEMLGAGITGGHKLTVVDDYGNEISGAWKADGAEKGDWFSVGDSAGTIGREVLAYEIDELLGLGLVPPTIEREHEGVNGSFQMWEDGETFANSPHSDREMIPRSDYLGLLMLDGITGNMDRHNNNAMITSDGALKAIDNGFSFPVKADPTREEVAVFMESAPGESEPGILTGEEQDYWMTRLNDPALGKLIDNSSIDDDAKEWAHRRIANIRRMVRKGDVSRLLEGAWLPSKMQEEPFAHQPPPLKDLAAQVPKDSVPFKEEEE